MLKYIKIILLLSLTNCSFQMIYKDGKVSDSYVGELATIRIKKDRNRLSQELKNNLYDALNPDYIKSEPKYFLILNITKATGSTFTTSTGSSGRNRVTLTINYELKSLDSGETISTGNTIVYDNYDVTLNRYGSYVADEYIQSNLTKIAAQNIRNSLVNDLIEMKKYLAKCGKVKCEEEKTPEQIAEEKEAEAKKQEEEEQKAAKKAERKKKEEEEKNKN